MAVDGVILASAHKGDRAACADKGVAEGMGYSVSLGRDGGSASANVQLMPGSICATGSAAPSLDSASEGVNSSIRYSNNLTISYLRPYQATQQYSCHRSRKRPEVHRYPIFLRLGAHKRPSSQQQKQRTGAVTYHLQRNPLHDPAATQRHRHVGQ